MEKVNFKRWIRKSMQKSRNLKVLSAVIMSMALAVSVVPVNSYAITYNLVVAKDGTGNYTTVQAAINAAPSGRTSWYNIYIKSGTYNEVVTIPSTKPYIHLIGQSKDSTILTYNKCNQTAGGSTTNSASTFVKAKNFIAENITFKNSFDYDNSTYTNKQAVALLAQADRQIYNNCRFIGHQDTLYTRTGRQYFKSCYIEGNVDYVFGDGTSVFDSCELRTLKNNGHYIAAPSTASTTTYGLVFRSCNLTAETGLANNSVYLGRPWHSTTTGCNSAATYLYCTMGAHINTAGWTSMSGVYPSTERLREYKNTGAGAVINSSRPQLTDSQAANYTVTNILKGSDSWNPVTVLSSVQ